MSLALANARIVTPEGVVEGSLSIDAGRIASVDDGGTVGEDLEGDLLIPGIVDLHTDNLEKHFFPRPNIGWNAVSAAIIHDGLCVSLGITTVFDSLSVGSFGSKAARTPDNLIAVSEGLAHAAKAGMTKADHRIHWRCETPSRTFAGWIEQLAPSPLTGLFSLMDHTPGQRQYRNLQRFLDMWRSEGMSEAEIEDRMAERGVLQRDVAPANRSLCAELARAHGVALASHDDETAAHIDEAADLGATIAEFPVTEEAALRARARGMINIMGGPNLIRGGSYSGNVPAARIAEMGLLDGFASDYVPRSLIECAFALAAEPFSWPIEKALDTASGVPARAAGLTDRGAIAPGLRADLVRVRLMEGRPIVRGVWTAGQRVG
jgi:alpha-D-ribose 1-methylphosphonate 5-triphosphate diphosphatase